MMCQGFSQQSITHYVINRNLSLTRICVCDSKKYIIHQSTHQGICGGITGLIPTQFQLVRFARQYLASEMFGGQTVICKKVSSLKASHKKWEEAGSQAKKQLNNHMNS